MEIEKVTQVANPAEIIPSDDNLEDLSLVELEQRIAAQQEITPEENPPAEPPEIVKPPEPPEPPEPVTKPAEPIQEKPTSDKLLAGKYKTPEELEKGYIESNREATRMAQQIRQQEQQIAQFQQQTVKTEPERRFTDKEVDDYVEQNPEHEEWGRGYKKETLKLEVMNEVEQKMTFTQDKNFYAQKAVTDFPELNDRFSDFSKRTSNVLREIPNWQKMPNAIYIAARIARAEMIPVNTPASVPVTEPPVTQTVAPPFIESGNTTRLTPVEMSNMVNDEKISASDLYKILPKDNNVFED